VPETLTPEEVLSYVRPMVLVLDAVGTITQATGTSIEIVGFRTGEMVGRNALEFVAPSHYEQMLSVFAGGGANVMVDLHSTFPLDLLDDDGHSFTADCGARRVRRADETMWVVTLSPHAFQSASFHATAAYVRNESSAVIARTIAERLPWPRGQGSKLRSFVLSDVVNRRFTCANEPGSAYAEPGLMRALKTQICHDAPWNSDLAVPLVTVGVDTLPRAIALAARAQDFTVASIGVARSEGNPHLALVSFGSHKLMFTGNLELILNESISTLEKTIRREQADGILRHEAEHDPLTGLSNRRRFSDAVDGRTRPTSALLYIDLDQFKAINDVYGHAVGDEVLIEVGLRIQSVCRPNDVVARLGGDEFGVLLSDVDAATAEIIARRVLHVIGQPLPCVLGPGSVSASGGLAIASTNDHVLDSADMAMFSAKRAGRSRLVII
jgi:diguanylate cyclase (GGDEF)-like protein